MRLHQKPKENRKHFSRAIKNEELNKLISGATITLYLFRYKRINYELKGYLKVCK